MKGKYSIITAQRYFFVLEILDQQGFNQAPFNPVLFLSVLRIHECMIEGHICFPAFITWVNVCVYKSP